MSKVVENYVEYVQEVIEKYSKNLSLVQESSDSITPQALNSALAQYLPTNMALIAEYQRAKIESYEVQKEYKEWEDEKFLEASRKLNEDAPKSMKISVKEIETQMRVDNKEEYSNWQDKLEESQDRERFLLRLVDMYKGFDSVLTTISRNMQQELRSLSLDNRMNQTGQENKVRRGKLED